MLEKVVLKEKVSQIVNEKTANFLKVKSGFQDTQFFIYIYLLPWFGSVAFVSIDYINETIFNLCAATNGIY